MLDTIGAFYVAALLCFVMLLVVYSVKDSHVPGVPELLWANVLGIGANVLYALGRELPPILAYELANALYASASAVTLLTYRRLFDKPLSTSLLIGAVTVLTALIAVFHYGIDSFTARTTVVSLFQAVMAGAIGYTVLSSRQTGHSAPYPFVFAVCMSSIVAGGHLYRLAQQLVRVDAPQSLLEPSVWNVRLMAVGAFALPVLTLGALLIVHRKIVAIAEHAAKYDFLTGVMSRWAFFDIGEHEIARAKRRKHPLSVLLIDLDNMKAINDGMGHAAGDAALKSFANAVSVRLGKTDCLARIGGDEFAVLLPDTGLTDAVTIANRLRIQTSTPSNAHQDGPTPIRVSFSIGVASLRPNEDFGTLLKRADTALYKAKTEGKNQVRAEDDVESASLTAY